MIYIILSQYSRTLVLTKKDYENLVATSSRWIKICQATLPPGSCLSNCTSLNTTWTRAARNGPGGLGVADLRFFQVERGGTHLGNSWETVISHVNIF